MIKRLVSVLISKKISGYLSHDTVEHRYYLAPPRRDGDSSSYRRISAMIRVCTLPDLHRASHINQKKPTLPGARLLFSAQVDKNSRKKRNLYGGCVPPRRPSLFFFSPPLPLFLLCQLTPQSLRDPQVVFLRSVLGRGDRSIVPGTTTGPQTEERERKKR